MSFNFENHSLSQYLDQMARREPVPGGGSAAALTAAMGASLIAMVANYSIGRKSNTKTLEVKLAKVVQSADSARLRLLELTTLDAHAYLKVSAARKLDAKAQKAAAKEARAVPQEVCKLCYKVVQLAPLLVEQGNPYLLSDIEVAVELLAAAFNSAKVMVRINS